LHVVYLNYFYDMDIPSVDALFTRYDTMTEWCKAVRGAGADRISVVQRFHDDVTIMHQGVEYHFVRDELPSRLEWWQNPRAVHERVAALEPGVVHANGLVFPLGFLRESLPVGCPIVWQHHGGPSPEGIRKIIRHAAFSVVDGLVFSSPEQGRYWRDEELVSFDHDMYDVVESSTRFLPASYLDSRMRTGMNGSPQILWVGRLDANKDPLTVLRGFAMFVHQRGEAHLVMIFDADDLLHEVEMEIETLAIGPRVCLLGKLEHTTLVDYYSATDIFVLGSHYEGSGFALLEAIACGATPVVTNIPSFRSMTHNGAIGALWSPGDASGPADALKRIPVGAEERGTTRKFFADHLSFEVIGKRALAIYRSATEKRRRLLSGRAGTDGE